MWLLSDHTRYLSDVWDMKLLSVTVKCQSRYPGEPGKHCSAVWSRQSAISVRTVRSGEWMVAADLRTMPGWGWGEVGWGYLYDDECCSVRPGKNGAILSGCQSSEPLWGFHQKFSFKVCSLVFSWRCKRGVKEETRRIMDYGFDGIFHECTFLSDWPQKKTQCAKCQDVHCALYKSFNSN